MQMIFSRDSMHLGTYYYNVALWDASSSLL